MLKNVFVFKTDTMSIIVPEIDPKLLGSIGMHLDSNIRF